MPRKTKTLLVVSFQVGLVVTVALGIVMAIDHHIQQDHEFNSEGSHIEAPFSTTPETTEEFVIDAFRDPEELMNSED